MTDAPAAGGRLAAKIIAVMSEVEGVTKKGRNDFHGYDYATEADIITAIRGSLITHGLAIVPGVREVSHQGDVTTLLMEFTLIDAESGESFTTGFVGAGQDKGDKGAYKALTGAEKYFLMKTFLISTGDDPEREDAPRQSSSSSAPRSRPTASSRPSGGGNADLTPPPFNNEAGDGYECEVCGGEIRDSKKYSAAQLAAMSVKGSGQILCYEHRFNS